MKKLLLFVIACTLGLFGAVNAQETLFYDDFGETYVGNSLDANWVTFQDPSATGPGWVLGYGSSNGGDGDTPCAASPSYAAGTCRALNYIVTKEAFPISESSELKWYMKHCYPQYAQNDTYWVIVLENLSDDNSENIVNAIKVSDALQGDENYNKSLSLSAYAGKTLHIGFFHDGYDGDYICIDNVELTGVSAGEGGGEEPEPTPVAPTAPVVIVETVTETTVELTWEAVDGADLYQIYRVNEGVEVEHDTTSLTTYTVEGLTVDTEYTFVVKAINEVGYSEASNVVTAKTLKAEQPGGEEPTPEPEPEDLCTVIFTLNDQYDGWYNDKLVVSYNETSQDLTFTENAKTKEYVLEIPQGATVNVVYQRGVSYSFPSEESLVIKYESGKEISSIGTMSNGYEHSFVVDCAPVVPEKPIVEAVATGETTIELAVTAIGADSYTIYQGTEVLAEGLTEATYTVEGLTADEEYCFTVVSVNEVGPSEVSDAACATTYKAGAAIVQIGDETSTIYGYYAPVSNMGYYANYSLSQQIYLKEEIGGEPCAITSVAFQNYYGGPNTRNIVVYMTNIDDAKDTFVGGADDWVIVSSADIVYQGEHTFGAADDWTTIEFETPFIYRGKNVCITVNDLTGITKEYSGYDAFYVTATENIRGIYATNQTSQFDCSNITATAILLQNQSYDYNTGSYVYTPYIVNAKIKTEPAEVEALPLPSTPANLVAETTGISSIALTWDAAENAATYNVYQGTELIATNLTTTSYAVEGLSDDTEYCFTVTAVNLEGESEASEPACATTEDFDGCFVTFTLGDTYGDGWTGNYLTVSYGETTDTLGFSVADFNYKEYSKEYVLPLAIGTNVTVSFVVPYGSTWPSENSFVVSYQGGNEIINVATGTFTDNNVGTFTYDTFVVNCNGEIEEPVAPAAPVVTVTPNGHNSLIFSWEPVDGATLYNVYSGEYVIAETTDTIHTIGNLFAEQNYCFSISAVTPNGETDKTEACGTTEAAPVAPAIPVVTYTTTDTTITLAWGTVDNATSYNIYPPQGFENVLGLIDTIYTFEGLTAGLEYCFLVYSVGASGITSSPAEVCVTITPAPVEPEPDQPGEELATLFFFDFNDGSMEGLRVFQGEDATGDNWQVTPEGDNFTYFSGYDATKGIYSCSFNNGQQYPYNYVVTEQAYPITEVSVLSWFIKPTDPTYASDDKYDVVASTDGITFDIVLLSSNGSGLIENELPLAEFAGQTLYLGFYHYTVGGMPGDGLVLDNIKLVGEEGTIPEEPVVPTPTAPAAPVVVADTVTETTVTLVWNVVENATSYNVYMDSLLVENVTDTVYTVTELTSDSTYDFTVTAVADTLESEASNVVTVTTLAEETDEPTDPDTPADTVVVLAAPVVVADTVTETTVTLVWNVVENATSYNVYMDTLLVENVTDTVYTVTELTSDSTYNFTVTAVADTLESEASNVVTVTTLAEEPSSPTDPDTPVDPEQPADTVELVLTYVATSTTDSTVTLTWNSVDSATSYNVYMDTTLVASVTDTVYTVTGLAADSTYSFTVAALNDTVVLATSNAVEVTTLPAETEDPEEPVDPEQPADSVVLAAPVVVADTVTATTVTLSWNAVEGATSYNVYMDTVLVKNVTDTVYTVTELTAETTYSFTVTAVADTLESVASNVVEVTTLKSEGIVENAAAFSIYPNPAVDRVVIATESTIESVSIYTLTGVMIYSEVDFNNNTINVSDFASGVYFIKVRTDNGEAVQRFIKK